VSLREIASADARAILNDSAGFRWPISVTDPAGVVSPVPPAVGALYGFGNDISQLIDPETGQSVSGRLPSVALHLDDLATTYGAAIPEGVNDPTIKPWLVSFDDITGNTLNFKIAQSNPDRGLGIITCELEFYDG